MTQPEEIVNAALLRIGDKMITSLSNSGDAAVTANELYGDQRDYLLQMFDWQFAMTRVSLGAAGVSNYTAYEYVYSLPSDCIRPVKVLSNSTYSYGESGNPWEIEANKLYTDQSVAWLLYVKQATDVAIYPPAFIEALAARLAWQVSYKLSMNKTLRDRLYVEATVAERRAKGYNQKKRSSDDAEPTLWTTPL